MALILDEIDGYTFMPALTVSFLGFSANNADATEDAPFVQFCLVLVSGQLTASLSIPLILSSGTAMSKNNSHIIGSITFDKRQRAKKL